MKFSLVSLLLLLSATNLHAASVDLYTDRSSFQSALTSFTTLDFEDACGGSPCTGSQSLGTTVSFGDSTFSNIGQIWGTGGFGAPSTQVGDQNNQDTVISLVGGYQALGMDIGLLFGSGNVNAELKDALGNTLFSGTLAVTDNNNLGTANTTFFGFIVNGGDVGELFLERGDFPTVDNLTYGTASGTSVAASTPATLILTLLASGFIGFRRKQAISRN